MSLKLDMSKTYNRMDWGFLEEVMTIMGNNNKLVQLIMNCVKIVTFLILINGEPHGPITPSRGFQQGDLLSLYLFLFYTEGLITFFLKMIA